MSCACLMGPGMWLGMTIPLVVLVALVVAGVLIVKAFWHRTRGHASNRDSTRALSLLEERYARGEIDADEFTARREHLVGTGG